MYYGNSRESSFTILKRYSHPKYWLTWLGLGFLRLLIFLPLPVLAVIGYILGSLFYLLHSRRRNIAYKNIRTCFPEFSDAKCRKINWHQFCLLGQSTITICMNWWISPARFDRLVTIHGREHHDEAVANGGAVILLTPHFLSLEVSGMALQREREMIGMYQYMKNPLINILALRGRSRFSNNGFMFERKGPLRVLIRGLRKGLPMFYSPDQDAVHKGVFAPFFGTLVSTTPALSKLVKVTNGQVIPCRNYIRPCKSIEDMIRQAPEQYLWVHKRFKTRPEGEPKFYD